MVRTIRMAMLAALTGGGVWMGCQSGASPGPVDVAGDDPSSNDLNQPVAVGKATAGPELRAMSAMEKAHFAFRAGTGAAFRARHTTHDVDVAGGAITIAPRHHTASGVVEGNPIELSTKLIARGEEILGNAQPTASVDAGNGHLFIDRGDVREELENFESGVEQSWHFADEPAGMGDLTVTVAVAGHPYAGATARGMHFLTPGKLGFVYGNATWIDADGQSTALAATFADGAITLTVPADVLANSEYPAVLDPVVGPEVAVDSPVIGWTGATSRRSSIASSGSGFLVVWEDQRNGSDSDIFGTRLSATGAVQDTLGISINEGAGVQGNPTVAFANGAYVVVWDDGSSIGAARVTTAGAVTQLGSLGSGTLPKIASRGAEALAVWQSGTDIDGARYDGTSFSAVTVATGVTAVSPAVSGSSGDYLVTWSEGATAPDLRGRFVTPAGGAGAPITISAGEGGQTDSAVAHDGTNFFVIWSNNNVGIDIFGTRVTSAGAVLDTHLEGAVTVGGVVVSAATNTQNQPWIACNPGACLATWSDRRDFATNLNDVYGQRLDASFGLVGTDIAIAALSDEQRNPSVAAQGGDYRVSWHDKRHHGTDAVFTARVNGDGSLPEGDGANIVTGNNRQTRPAVDSAPGASWLTTWSDSRVLGSDIMGVRFASNGVKLDATARPVSTASGQQGNPTITYDGLNYLVAWNDARSAPTRDIYAARVATNGTVLDAAGIPIVTATGDQENPSAASGGGVSLIVWQDGRSNFDIYGALVDQNGTVTMSDIQICVTPGAQVAPSVAYEPVNNTFLVAWQSGTAGGEDVFGTLVSTTGAVSVPCGASISGAQTNAQVAPRVTAGGGQFFVVWNDSRNDPDGDIRGTRVTATGGTMTVVDASGIGIATGAAAQSEPDVAFINPGLYVAVWTQDSGGGNDVMAQNILTGGQLDSTAYVISANPESETGPAIAAGPAGQPALVAYEKLRTDVDTQRVNVRRVTFAGSTGTSCNNDAQCTSGFCVDSRCCDTACGGPGTDLTDCQACSVSRGAQQNGICSVILNTNHTCRYYADTFCDRLEKCDGVTVDCPPDLGRREGQNCTIEGGGAGVCPANDITGAPHVCQ